MASKRKFQALSLGAASSMKVCKNRKLTSKILKIACEQQREIENEDSVPISNFFRQAVLDDFIDDYDETQTEPDYHDLTTENTITEREESLLDALFQKDRDLVAKRISDAVISIKAHQDKDEATETTSVCKTEAINFIQSLGKFMSAYTHGKMPKAFNHIARLENWDSLLKMTQPENWSPSAMLKATNMFASSSKAGRFYELFLLPRVREDIRKHRKLHFSLYQSLKKALFKPDRFYSGILISLCKSGTCTLSEAVIIASIIQKLSIPEKISSDALVRLAEMKFCGTTSFFIKVILEKKYALAYGAIDAVTSHFLRFHKETRVMPVIWHQTLLAFVQLYKYELKKEDKKCLRSLLEKQNHELLTPEIVRELDNTRNRGEKPSDSPSASTNNKPIKEDLFDMPEVPMEED